MIHRTALIGTLALALLLAAGCGGNAADSYECAETRAPVCNPGETRPCYDGPEGTEGTGVCKAGTQTCDALGVGFGACVAQVLPAPDDCSAPTSFSCSAPNTCGAMSPAEATFGTPWATVVAVDSKGDVANVVVSSSDAVWPSFAVEKHAPDGTLRWRVAASPERIDCVTILGVVHAPDDDVIVYGSYGGSESTVPAGCAIDLGAGPLPPTDEAGFVARYAASDGTPRWVRTYPAEFAGLAVGTVDTDTTGAIVMTANYTAAGKLGTLDLPAPPATGGSYLAMLDASGEPLWAQPLSEHPEEVRLAVDRTGTIFILSKRVREISYDACFIAPPSNAVLSAFEADGTPRFQKVFGDGASGLYGTGLAVDADGRVAITGMVVPLEEPGPFDIGGVSVDAGAFLGVLDPAQGDALWMKSLPGWVSGGLLFDDHGNLILAGNDASRVTVARYTSTGELFSLAASAEVQTLHWVFAAGRGGDRIWVASAHTFVKSVEDWRIEGWVGALHHADP